MNKTCIVCKETKHTTLFYRDKTSKDGIKSRCKLCSNAAFRSWTSRNKEADKARKKKWKETNPDRAKELQLQYHYGISLEDYKHLAEQQEQKCAICKKEAKLVVDHCHQSGKVRGLLCSPCNKGLGMLGDTVDSITNVLRYLNESTDL